MNFKLNDNHKNPDCKKLAKEYTFCLFSTKVSHHCKIIFENVKKLNCENKCTKCNKIYQLKIS